jgi:isoleucyl-tRNA synthetase
VVDLGAFYLDVIKDRLYTTGRKSPARRSAQTAMYHIIEAMVRWLAPVLSFTAEEIWAQMPGERGDSVFLSTWHRLPAAGSADPGELDWKGLLRVRETAARALEALRVSGAIGSGLDARLTVFADGRLYQDMQRLGDELRFVFITSGAVVRPVGERGESALAGEGLAGEGFWVQAEPDTDAKCVRCWHRLPDVGKHAAHPELCGRCVTNIDGPGETRRYV